ncbi:hypothetical protein SAMN06297144_1240 [Sphingomonas guangdongensis]|uniref:26 kDa periplasmic immunogenic protein n=1 Tax=Sphingomonas guangdongensis TaxID=1141890 RepID=A0A285QH45_9SPHN|nr:SIMPL domain-containing protein [Sphingomonas guangdongensis]SOB80794.1 hypothetical protein SAMN06297144_1240 [Sphingomonas guangdongensis]
MFRPLAAALMLASPVVAAAQVPPPPPPPIDGTLLEVSAAGRVARVPDVATIRAGVVTQAASANEALAANATRMSGVLAALKGAGVAPRDLQSAAVQLQPQYRYGENVPPVITGYQATNSVSVRLRDIARGGRVLDALVGAGANQIDGPTLSIDQPDAALDEARTQAIATARARAELYARAAGLRVARIVSITESGDGYVPAPPPIVMMARIQSDRPETQIAPGEQDVSVTVQVRFLLR